MHILVTGGTGFVGTQLINLLLEKGFQVTTTCYIRPLQLDHPRLRSFTGNLASLEFCRTIIKGIEAIFHTAAKAGIWGSWQSYFDANVLTTRNLLQAAQEYRVPYFIYTSSPSVVFGTHSISNGSEVLPYSYSPISHYAHTKALAEQSVLAANSPSLKTIALRPHLIWGTGDPHLFPRIFQKAKAGKLIQIGTGTNWVDTTHITNTVQAHWQALQAIIKGRGHGKAYFISDGSPVQMWPWIQTILEKHHLPLVSRHISFSLAYGIGAALEWGYRLLGRKMEPPMTRFLALQLAHDHYFQISAAQADLDYVPVVSREQGLEAYKLEA